jgi:hypothetical protein
MEEARSRQQSQINRKPSQNLPAPALRASDLFSDEAARTQGTNLKQINGSERFLKSHDAQSQHMLDEEHHR